MRQQVIELLDEKRRGLRAVGAVGIATGECIRGASIDVANRKIAIKASVFKPSPSNVLQRATLYRICLMKLGLLA